MKYNSKTPRADVVIQKRSFKIPQPFEAGHVLNENEARAINQVLCENIRNNQAKMVADAVTAGSSDEEIQKKLDVYVTEYEFGMRRAGGKGGDPVRAKALEIAITKVRQAYKKKGVPLKDIPTSEIKARAEEALTKYPQILKSAAAIIETQNASIGGLEIET